MEGVRKSHWKSHDLFYRFPNVSSHHSSGTGAHLLRPIDRTPRSFSTFFTSSSFRMLFSSGFSSLIYDVFTYHDLCVAGRSLASHFSKPTAPLFTAGWKTKKEMNSVYFLFIFVLNSFSFLSIFFFIYYQMTGRLNWIVTNRSCDVSNGEKRSMIWGVLNFLFFLFCWANEL